MTPMFMQRPKFLEQIEAARPGDTVTYHTGFLMLDRIGGSSFIEINATACAAWDQMESGKVTLLQRRIDSGVYEYRARKNSPPHVPVEWFGPYAKDHRPYVKPKMLPPRPLVPAVERQPAYA